MVSILEELHDPLLFGKRLEVCDDPSQLPANNEHGLRYTGVSLRRQYKPLKCLSPRFLFLILVTDSVREYPLKRPNPFFDFPDLIHICGGLLQERISDPQDENAREAPTS